MTYFTRSHKHPLYHPPRNILDQVHVSKSSPPQYHHILAHDIVPLPSILHLPGAYVGIGYCSCTSDGTAET